MSQAVYWVSARREIADTMLNMRSDKIIPSYSISFTSNVFKQQIIWCTGTSEYTCVLIQNVFKTKYLISTMKYDIFYCQIPCKVHFGFDYIKIILILRRV